ncbi:MAG TPA: hypothetical protein VMZ28_08095 [Kofleriaceae bacterium]|nr:hypothetical protein [Kofleriaceae bacterium]
MACGKGGGGDAGKLISDYGALKDKLCKCADKACADGVAKETEAFMAKSMETMEKTKPTKEQDEQFDKIEDEMEACAKKFETAEAPPAGGDMATPPAGGDTATPPAGGDMATPPAGGEKPAEGGEKPATP